MLRCYRRMLRYGHAINARSRTVRTISKMKPIPEVKTRGCEEIKIPVPWGHIAAKWWGTQSVRPILGIHGLKDNCSTFDSLAPLLPSHVGFLAIDWPGHGYSSHLPAGISNSCTLTPTIIHMIIKYFNWTSISLIGHAFGSGVGFVYASIFPKAVDFLIGIDSLLPLYHRADQLSDLMAMEIEKFIRYDSKQNSNINFPHKLSFDDAISEKCKESLNSLNKDHALCLLQRDLEICPEDRELCYKTQDQRNDCRFPGWSVGQLKYFATKIVCPVYNLKAKQSPYLDNSSIYYDAIGVIKMNSKNCKFVEIDGNHYVHLTNPRSISALINPFITEFYKYE